jgi:DNA modification methylase
MKGKIESEISLIMDIKQASLWASEYLKRQINPSNISYLVQYGRIRKYTLNGRVFIDIRDLKDYYDKNFDKINAEKYGDINWHLSFANYTEKERTKHVHRLHPYKGKFIPQLVEYFLDNHTDEFKKEVYFNQGDIVLDPFCGSGTTLVQANELGIHAIGIDISYFNTLIANVKIKKHNLILIESIAKDLTRKLINFQDKLGNIEFEKRLTEELTNFNNRYFPSPDYKRKVAEKLINEEEYGKHREQEFAKIYENIKAQYGIKIETNKRSNRFMDIWFSSPVKYELEFLAEEIKSIEDEEVREVLILILSRTARSCRATTHADLATLKEPVYAPYYCKKHRKICKPIFSISKWWKFYVEDTISRLSEFSKVRTDTMQICLIGDARTIDLQEELSRRMPNLAELVMKKKIKGIFTSPPYVGLIDYHEQHAYAYELFGFERRDDLEIGALSKGRSAKQREAYVIDISKALLNLKRYLVDDYDVFIVANDKYGLYPKIAELAGMKIVNEFKRPVLCRVEKNRETLYYESIFHLKEGEN